MSETTRGGLLGAVALAELRQVAAMRERLAQQRAALDEQEARLLALVADAQGCPVEAGHTRFGYDADAAEPRWWIIEEPRVLVAVEPPAEDGAAAGA